MAFGFIKSTQAAAASVSTLAITIPAVKVGYLVIVNIKLTSVVTGMTVTDNASIPNTYALAIGPIGISNVMYQYYGVAATAGATTVTISWTGVTDIRATVEQFSGGKLTNATVFDKAASNTGTGTSGSVSLSPTNAGELISACVGLSAGASAVTKGANYIIGTNNNSTSTEYRQVGTTSETAPITWTGSLTWSEIAGAYIPAANNGNFLEMFK